MSVVTIRVLFTIISKNIYFNFTEVFLILRADLLVCFFIFMQHTYTYTHNWAGFTRRGALGTLRFSQKNGRIRISDQNEVFEAKKAFTESAAI